jgi:hypothetical protein
VNDATSGHPLTADINAFLATLLFDKSKRMREIPHEFSTHIFVSYRTVLGVASAGVVVDFDRAGEKSRTRG